MKRLRFVVGLAFACWSSVASAETENGLYGAAVPKDAVFIRALGVTPTAWELFGRTLPGEVLPDGVFVAFAPSHVAQAEPGAHYSVVRSDDGTTAVIQEPDRDQPSKVHLSLLNMGATDAALSVANGGPQVLGGVKRNTARTRGVNPVAVTLTVDADGVASEFDVVLRRKQNLTFVVHPSGHFEIIEDTYGPVFDGEAK